MSPALPPVQSSPQARATTFALCRPHHHHAWLQRQRTQCCYSVRRCRRRCGHTGFDKHRPKTEMLCSSLSFFRGINNPPPSSTTAVGRELGGAEIVEPQEHTHSSTAAEARSKFESKGAPHNTGHKKRVGGSKYKEKAPPRQAAGATGSQRNPRIHTGLSEDASTNPRAISYVARFFAATNRESDCFLAAKSFVRTGFGERREGGARLLHGSGRGRNKRGSVREKEREGSSSAVARGERRLP